MPWKVEQANAEPVGWQPDGGREGHSMVSDEKLTVNLIYDDSFLFCCPHSGHLLYLSLPMEQKWKLNWVVIVVKGIPDI